jgi:tRNA pseudouridine55 synthase|uniref:tRNA pseudouridine(55) synthase TruB n=1 Tax=Candidatus Planktophila sp. TaxID=2175601 RepID=UPI0040493BA5
MSATDGFVVVDKAGAMTSHDVVAIGRRVLGTRKVGHAGTLDPMATGILILGFGHGTRLLQYITDGDKSYRATIALGASTITDDIEGEITSKATQSQIANTIDEDIRSALASMRGMISQRPSSVSAVKVDGKRAHERVRAGEVFELASREVTISQLDVLEIRRSNDVIEVDIEVTCSAGTFIRAIARDLGATLNIGGHLTFLRRTRVASFGEDVANPFEKFKSGDFKTLGLVDVAKSIFKVRDLTSDEAAELSFGRKISASASTGIYAAISATHELIALLENRDDGAKPIAVFAPAN